MALMLEKTNIEIVDTLCQLLDEQKGKPDGESYVSQKTFVTDHQEIQGRAGQSAVTVRRILQWWGTEYRRNQDPDYWTKAWSRKVEQFDLENTHVLIDDVRFMNELSTIKSHGGLIVKIERPGFDGANNHASETSLDDYKAWDGTIVNDGSLEEFKAKIEQLADVLLRDSGLG